MTPAQELKTLVEQFPNPDGRGMLTENIDQDQIENTVTAIYKGGRANLQGLIDMLGEPGSPENVKPHYALHCLRLAENLLGDGQRDLALKVYTHLRDTRTDRSERYVREVAEKALQV